MTIRSSASSHVLLEGGETAISPYILVRVLDSHSVHHLYRQASNLVQGSVVLKSSLREALGLCQDQ